MAENSPIEWTDHTWSPWEGCTKVSPGCDHCYAEGMNRWLRKGANWGPGAPRRTYSAEHWLKPVRWNEAAAKAGTRPKVFPSVCDPFDNEVDAVLRGDFIWLVEHTPNLIWLVLTKRIGNAVRMLAELGYAEPLPNLWLGATVVNQEEADRDIPKLLATPARVRFLSMEPLLGPVNLRKWLDPWTCADCEFHGSENDCGPDGCEKCGESDAFPPGGVCKNCGADDQAAKPSCPQCGSSRSYERDAGFKFDSEQKLIDWVIAGGESGHGARPMHPDWARSLRDQCAAAVVPFLFKQWGEWAPQPALERILSTPSIRVHKEGGCSAYTAFDPACGDYCMHRAGKKAAGRLLDGRTHDGFPER